MLWHSWILQYLYYLFHCDINHLLNKWINHLFLWLLHFPVECKLISEWWLHLVATVFLLQRQIHVYLNYFISKAAFHFCRKLELEDKTELTTFKWTGFQYGRAHVAISVTLAFHFHFFHFLLVRLSMQVVHVTQIFRFTFTSVCCKINLFSPHLTIVDVRSCHIGSLTFWVWSPNSEWHSRWFFFPTQKSEFPSCDYKWNADRK